MNLEKRDGENKVHKDKSTLHFMYVLLAIVISLFVAWSYIIKSENKNVQTVNIGFESIQKKLHDCENSGGHTIIDFKKVDSLSVITVQCNPK